jgi:hypothetical protein
LRKLLEKMCEWECGNRFNLDESLEYLKIKF